MENIRDMIFITLSPPVLKAFNSLADLHKTQALLIQFFTLQDQFCCIVAIYEVSVWDTDTVLSFLESYCPYDVLNSKE